MIMNLTTATTQDRIARRWILSLLLEQGLTSSLLFNLIM
uniref:Uncharacterized protein n=1 Tax=Amphimedon queenslandica TaxID=400682 RepID=A0A1X7V650_AMPQE